MPMECSAVLVCGSSFQKGPLLADYDLVIIGGGPAGLTAGLYAARANMSAVLLEGKDVGGEILNTDLIEDYPGFASVTGTELAQKMADHARKFGLKIETYARVKQIRIEGDRKVIELEDGTTHRAYAVIITVGGEPTKLGVPGEAEYHGRGVSYCAVCDGAFFKGNDLAVVGGGDSAFQEGLFLTRFAKKLHVVHRRGEFRAQAILQDRLLAKDLVHTVTPAVLHAERYIEELRDMERAFPQAPREVVAETASRMKILTFPPGAVVKRQGEASDRFYVIAKGEAVVVHREPDGSERTLNTLHAGDYFGEVGILTGHARNATVRAKTSLEVLALDADGLRTLMSSSQKTGDAVARVAKSRERIEDGAAN